MTDNLIRIDSAVHSVPQLARQVAMAKSVPSIGIYEKALPQFATWQETAESALRSGYDFIELSIDGSAEKLRRLDAAASEVRNIRDTFVKNGLPVFTINLSALREFELGSADPGRRRKGMELLERGIDFCADIGAACVLVPGYYSFRLPAGTEGRVRFIAALSRAADRAARRGVMIAIENMDGNDVTCTADARSIIDEINSPSVSFCPDVGNLCANGLNVCSELLIAHSTTAIIGIHLKETCPGVFRGIRFGEGIVPFEAVIETLHKLNYYGPYVVEMWNQNRPDAEQLAAAAHAWIRDLICARYSSSISCELATMNDEYHQSS